MSFKKNIYSWFNALALKTSLARRAEKRSRLPWLEMQCFCFPMFPSHCLWHTCWQVLDEDGEQIVVLKQRKNSPINHKWTCCVKGSVVKRKHQNKMSKVFHRMFLMIQCFIIEGGQLEVQKIFHNACLRWCIYQSEAFWCHKGLRCWPQIWVAW